MSQREDLVVLDVPDVVADEVVVPLVGPEDLAAFPAHPDLVLPVDAEGAHPVPGDAAPLPDTELPGEAVRCPLLPVDVARVPDQAAPAVRQVLVIILGVMRPGGFDTGYHVVQEVQFPVHRIEIDLGKSYSHVCEQICGGVPVASDPLPRMDLLDDFHWLSDGWQEGCGSRPVHSYSAPGAFMKRIMLLQTYLPVFIPDLWKTA